ncbi:hypothetical protein Taro_052408 [Colocasia esculenta]|uniref:Retrotransposon gag domain-containing protein n=1 Tax=Colocasia esculenta TaxID=4460 RepID=A0A843XJA2_COLES|nr:hypothetical protein [Colocasia esculenta]
MDAYSELAAIDVDVYLPDLLRFQIWKHLRKCRPWFRKPSPNGANISTSSEEIVRSESERESEIFCVGFCIDMASCSRRGVPALEGEQRRDEPRRFDQGEQQAPAPQGPVLPPPPPVDYGVFMQGLVQAKQTQAHTQAQVEAQQAQERADMWWSLLLRTRFKDGAVEVGMDEFVRLFRAKFVPEHIQDKMEQKFLSLTQGSMTVLVYEARFAELSKYAPHIVADERRKAKKFVMGLRPSLRMRLVAFDHRNLEQALSAVCRQEGEME